MNIISILIISILTILLIILLFLVNKNKLKTINEKNELLQQISALKEKISF
jgi:uncharacterized protein (DUF3084 family)